MAMARDVRTSYWELRALLLYMQLCMQYVESPSPPPQPKKNPIEKGFCI